MRPYIVVEQLASGELRLAHFGDSREAATAVYDRLNREGKAHGIAAFFGMRPSCMAYPIGNAAMLEASRRAQGGASVDVSPAGMADPEQPGDSLAGR